MPMGLRVILIVNFLALATAGWGVYRQLTEGVTAPQATVVAAVTAVGLLIVQLVILLRRPALLPVARGALYAVMLVQGLLLLLMLRRLMSGEGIVAFVTTLVLLIYLIGARGYLNETAARQYFGR